MSEGLAGKTLLLVEDELLIALDEQALLQKHGFRVVTVHNAEKALQTVQNTDIDLVLMDIDLGPGKMDGTKAAEAILAVKNLPIVFLTNHTEKEMVSKVKGLTRYGYVLKNAGEFVLVESISMAFELFDAHEQLKAENQERKIAEQKMEETAEFYRHLMENSIDAVYLLSETGKVLAVNSVACRMIGYSREELLNLTIDDIDPNYPSRQFVEFWEGRPEGATILFNTVHRHQNGYPIDVEVNGIFFILNGEKYLYGVARDIRERKRSELALKESEEKYRRIFNNTPNLISEVDFDSFTILSCNPAMARAFGQTPEGLEGKDVRLIIPPDVLRTRESYGLKALETGEIQIFEDERNGRHFQNTFIPVEHDGRRIVQTITADITDWIQTQQQLRDAEQSFRSLAESAGVAITVIQDDELRYVNSTATDISGYSKEEMRQGGIGKMLERIHPDDREMVLSRYQERRSSRLKNDSETLSFPPLEYRHVREDGKIIWIEAYTSIIQYGGAPALLVIHNDITERKNAQQYQEFLMKELNHRVKNSLMLISSLISMKNDEVGDSVDLSDLQRRIDAVRIVHEQLNRSADISSINLRDYITELLSAVFSFARQKVRTELRIDVESLPTKTALAVGLILNEIATNALKRGFAADTKPLFSVAFEAELEAGMYTMTISNNGRPFPREIDLDHPDTMGLRLVAALIDQIDGSIQLQKEPAPVFSIRFPME
ncbi:MAG: PAS domain S-box protein [Sediminispirochaetaceae bacterium]